MTSRNFPTYREGLRRSARLDRRADSARRHAPRPMAGGGPRCVAEPLTNPEGPFAFWNGSNDGPQEVRFNDQRGAGTVQKAIANSPEWDKGRPAALAGRYRDGRRALGVTAPGGIQILGLHVGCRAPSTRVRRPSRKPSPRPTSRPRSSSTRHSPTRCWTSSYGADWLGARPPLGWKC